MTRSRSSRPTSAQLLDRPQLEWPTESGAPPRFATPRDPAWISDGPLVALIAEALGTPLLPWQRHVVDVATEHRITDEENREYHYRTVVVSVPRQTGKTTLIHALAIYRAMVLGHDFFYTAQTGKDARARWMDAVKAMRKSAAFRGPLRDKLIRVALRGGSEHVEFANGHVFQAFAPTEDSLHGYTPPTVCLDEAFAHNETQGEMLMGAISPAQQTIRAKQLWIVSTMGTAESTFLHNWIDRAVERAPRVAGFFWGATEEHNAYDLDDIAAYHPGVGFKLNDGILTAVDVLAEAEGMTRAEYERAFANRRTLTASHMIPPDAWRTLADEKLQLPEDLHLAVIAYDVSLDRRSASIVATWRDATGKPAGKIIASAPGVAWLADYLEQIDQEHRPAEIVTAGHGPVLEVTEQLTRRGVRVETLGEREFATASGAFLTAVETAAFTHDGTQQLAESATGLATRTGVVDGVALSRRHSVGDSSPGIALALGLWRLGIRDDDRAPITRFSA